jgi:NAD+ kinase
VATVGLVLHHERDQAADLARSAAKWLADRGHDVRLPAADAALAGLDDRAVAEPDLPNGVDLVVSLGGDGTMLRAVDLVGETGVPVLGVNVGQLGYLTQVEPDDLEGSLDTWLAGGHTVEERMLLDVTVEAAGGWDGTRHHVGLNEAVVEKTPMGHTVRLAVSIDDDFFTTYAADGLIVATPTGSTAYAFSARGPIVEPEHRALLLVAVSPHMLFDRTLVLGPSRRIRLEVCGHRPATLSVDGRNLGSLDPGDAIVCTAAGRSARLVTFGPRDFHRILKEKFGLNDR